MRADPRLGRPPVVAVFRAAPSRGDEAFDDKTTGAPLRRAFDASKAASKVWLRLAAGWSPVAPLCSVGPMPTLARLPCRLREPTGPAGAGLGREGGERWGHDLESETGRTEEEEDGGKDGEGGG